jgi:hypothetical protein
VPSSQRGTFTASVKLPAGAQTARAAHRARAYHFQDSALDPSAYQYWADIVNGTVTIPRVKAGTYRLTVYAKGTPLATVWMVTMAYEKPGIFGDYVEDGLVIGAGKTLSHNVTWTAESAGPLSSPVHARISKALTSFLQARSSGGSELLTRLRASSRTASSATSRTRAPLPVRRCDCAFTGRRLTEDQSTASTGARGTTPPSSPTGSTSSSGRATSSLTGYVAVPAKNARWRIEMPRTELCPLVAIRAHAHPE